MSTPIALASYAADRAPAAIELGRGLGADTDAKLVELWLHGRSHNTQDAYRREVGRFLQHVRGVRGVHRRRRRVGTSRRTRRRVCVRT